MTIPDEITKAEIVDWFGDTMPWEAWELLAKPPADMTVANVRQKLREMGAAHKAGTIVEVLSRLSSAIDEATSSAAKRAGTYGHPDDVDDNFADELAGAFVRVRLADLTRLMQAMKVGQQ